MHAEASVAAPRYSRANPFPAKLLVNRSLSGPESAKDTRHFELDLTGWGLTFEVGDSLAVYATNDPELVDEIIRTLGATGNEKVPRPKGEPTTLREALLRDYSITQPTPKFLRAMAERAPAAPTLTYLLAPNRKQDPDTPIIMIGPGTGVAPFRAYLQERKAIGAKGKNWLFFGAQHERCDFAYGDEFNAYMKEGLLTRLDCAWSRDQTQKIYVQHKM